MFPGKTTKYYDIALITIIIIIFNLILFRVVFSLTRGNSSSAMGGVLYWDAYDEDYGKGYVKPDDDYIERFLRPSNIRPIEKKYFFEKDKDDKLKYFAVPSEVVRAYFDILSDASNIEGSKGGCGSIGFGKEPYPYAYNLLSESFKKSMSYEKFVKSFEGIGHINLLKIIDTPAVRNGDNITPTFFVEIETIEGSQTAGKTYFAYYYGSIAVEKNKDSGWKINYEELNSEDFLCHAYHGWWHDASTLVDVVYGKKCGIIEKILGVEEDGYLRYVLAKGKDGKQYRFHFVRLTNGADIEIRQCIMEDGKWKDVHIDTSKYEK